MMESDSSLNSGPDQPKVHSLKSKGDNDRIRKKAPKRRSADQTDFQPNPCSPNSSGGKIRRKNKQRTGKEQSDLVNNQSETCCESVRIIREKGDRRKRRKRQQKRKLKNDEGSASTSSCVLLQQLLKGNQFPEQGCLLIMDDDPSDSGIDGLSVSSGDLCDGLSGCVLLDSDVGSDAGDVSDDTCLCEAPCPVCDRGLSIVPEVVALDCEFVGVGPSKRSALGRCSIVDYHGQILCDMYVQPHEPITDYRTPWSGIRPCHMHNAYDPTSARQVIASILKNKIVVGHAIHHDFSVLGIHPPKSHIRDTSRHSPLISQSGLHKYASLQKLSKALLGLDIQTREHCSVEDSRAAMELYRLVEQSWEKELSAAQGSQDQTAAAGQNTAAKNTCSDSAFFRDEFWPDDQDL